MRERRPAGAIGAALVLLVGLLPATVRPAGAQTTAHYFPETHHTVSGVFWDYWQSHGGLARQGYPITEEFAETSAVDHKQHTVQYFERAVFELHPENAAPYNVLLSPLGAAALQARYPSGAPAGQHANTDKARTFSQTGHSLGGGFAAYWDAHGGLAQFGYPLTDEFAEPSGVDGKTYTVQYFERAVFEDHPEAPPAFQVMLSLLGRAAYHSRYETITYPRPGQMAPAPGLAPPTAPVLFSASFATDDLSPWKSPPSADGPPLWSVLNAHLQQGGDANGETADQDTVLLAGSPAWRDYIFDAQFFESSGEPIGVVWRAQPDHAYRVEVLPALPNTHWKAALERVDGTQVTTLATTPAAQFAGYQFSTWHTIRVITQGAHQQVRIDGVALLDVADSALAQGQIGVYAYEDGAAGFDNIRVQQIAP